MSVEKANIKLIKCQMISFRKVSACLWKHEILHFWSHHISMTPKCGPRIIVDDFDTLSVSEENVDSSGPEADLRQGITWKLISHSIINQGIRLHILNILNAYFNGPSSSHDRGHVTIKTNILLPHDVNLTTTKNVQGDGNHPSTPTSRIRHCLQV